MTFDCKSANCYAKNVQFRKTLFECMLFFLPFIIWPKWHFLFLSLIISTELLLNCAKLIMTIQISKLFVGCTIWITMYHKLVFFFFSVTKKLQNFHGRTLETLSLWLICIKEKLMNVTLFSHKSLVCSSFNILNMLFKLIHRGILALINFIFWLFFFF